MEIFFALPICPFALHNMSPFSACAIVVCAALLVSSLVSLWVRCLVLFVLVIVVGLGFVQGSLMTFLCWGLWTKCFGKLRSHVYVPRKRLGSRFGVDPYGDLVRRVVTLADDAKITLYSTSAHLEMITKFTSLCKGLEGNRYLNKNGAATCLLVGAKGIGKTMSARVFVETCQDYFANVTPVYVNFYGLQQRFNWLHRDSLLGSVMFDLFHWTDLVPAIFGLFCPLSDLYESLLTRDNRNILIVVDELDELYRQNSRPIFQETLAELQSLGNGISGRVSIVLCGSSAMLPMLISKNTMDHKQFPLLLGAPNLNSTKFHAFQIYSPTSVSIDIVRQLRPNLSLQDLRAILFLTGGNVREIDKVETALVDYQSPYNSPYSSNLWQDKSIRSLLMAILDKLYKKNKDRCQLDKYASIRETDWEVQFQPLSYKEVEALWKTLQDEDKTLRSEKERLMEFALHLSDRGWIVVTSDNRFYPASMYILMQRHDEKNGTKHIHTIGMSLVRFVRDLLTSNALGAASS